MKTRRHAGADAGLPGGMPTSFDRRTLLCGGCSLLATACTPDPLGEPSDSDTGTVDPGTDTSTAPQEYPCGQQIDPTGAGWTALPLSEYPDLADVGGWYSVGSVIVAHAIQGCYVAIERACTHEGVPVDYKPNRFQFVCPRHGAVYDLQGEKVSGPQPTGLPVYPCGRVGDTIYFDAS